MIRLFQIAVFSFLFMWVTGCGAPAEDVPIWEQVKIGDLAAPGKDKQPGSQMLKTINFGVHVFEIPAENIDVLDDIRQMLSTRPVQFHHYDAFAANLFSVGFGPGLMWNSIADLLHATGGRMQTVLLLLEEGEAHDLMVTGLPRRQNVFHVSSDGSMKGGTVGPGKLALRIKAAKVPGFRGVCNVSVQPVFTSLISPSISRLVPPTKSGEFVFSSAGFDVKMGRGDLFFLGPTEYSADQITFGSLFFSRPEGRLFFNKTESGAFLSRPERKPTVRVFLFVCTKVSV